MMFRSDSVFGAGYKNIVDVMVYETHAMGNPDILYTLSESIFKEKNPELSMQMRSLGDELSENGTTDDFGEYDWKKFFEGVVFELNKMYDTHLKYCLWLADYDTVKNFYGKGKLSQEDIDAYEESGIVLSDIGKSGKLYAYPEMPKKVEYTLEEEMER